MSFAEVGSIGYDCTVKVSRDTRVWKRPYPPTVGLIEAETIYGRRRLGTHDCDE